MYLSLLSPDERDADHPVRGTHVRAEDGDHARHHQAAVMAGGWMLAAALIVLMALR